MQEVHDLYLFDRKLRQVIFDALQTVEIAMRAHVSYYLAHKYGAFGYVYTSNFSSYFVYHDQWMEGLQSVIDRSREEFDEEALLEFLQSRPLSSAYLDVFREEPLPEDSPLRSCPNCLIMPHASAIAPEFMDFFIEDFLARYAE